jgi:hypothetical protein
MTKTKDIIPRVEEIRVIFKNVIFFFQVMKDGCEKSFGPQLEIKMTLRLPPGINPFNQIPL